MAENKHSFDADFEAINSLFEDYSKSVNLTNVKDFKSAAKTKLTEQVWNTLYKVPKNRYNMTHNAAGFVKTLNDCLAAYMKNIKAGKSSGSFSQYIYNTIPRMIDNDPDAKKPDRSNAEIEKIQKVQKWYEDFQKRGNLTHIQIIKKISILTNLSEKEVDDYSKVELFNSSSECLYNEEDSEESDITSSDIAIGKQTDFASPESNYILLSNIEEAFDCINEKWLLISEDIEKKCLSDLLTEYFLRSYKTAFTRENTAYGLSLVNVDFDIASSCEKYAFLNKDMVYQVMSGDNKDLPGQWEIGKMYYPDINKDTVNHKLKRFLDKAVEKLK